MEGYIRKNDDLIAIPQMKGYRSPALGIRFERIDNELMMFKPDGKPFLTREQLEDDIELELEHERSVNDKLAKKLRELGIDPDTLK